MAIVVDFPIFADNQSKLDYGKPTTQTTRIGKFIDPLTDWGFRRLFGQEPNKEILIEFLNDLFQGEKHIIDLTYVPDEYDGDDVTDKRVIFDLHCRGDNGEYFIVEMQRIRQDHFKDKALFYVSRLIQQETFILGKMAVSRIFSGQRQRN